MRWFAIVALVAGCRGEKLKWNEQKLVAIDSGPFHFDIPTGWRDLSESQDLQLAHMARRLGDAHLIVRQNDTNTDTNIAFMWSELVGKPTCEQFIAAMETQAGAPKFDRASLVSETFGDDPGCSYAFTDEGSEGRAVLRMHGRSFLTIQEMHTKRGDTDADATFGRFIAALKSQ